MRRVWLDIVIGWNEGAAERHERLAAIARRRENNARRQYRRRYMTRWPR